MRTKVVLCFLVAALLSSLAGCSFDAQGNNNNKNPQATSLLITPRGPGLSTSSSLQLNAVAFFPDGTLHDVSSKADWSSSNASIATVSGGLAKGAGAGQATITANYQSVNASTPVNVVTPPATAPNLSGSYAFQFTSVDSRGAAYYVGSFTADGNGNITGGLEDANTASGVVASVALTGTYFVFPDGRGQISFDANSIYASGAAFRFVLVAGGSKGLAVQFDDHGTSQGSFELQDPSALKSSAFNGNYVFHMGGFTPAQNPAGPVGEVGIFSVDGTSLVTGGESDTLADGVASHSTDITGSYVIADTGRGTFALTDSFGATTNYVAYVVSANRFYLMQTDSDSAGSVLAGVAEQQQPNHIFTDADLTGAYNFLLDTNPDSSAARFDVIGHIFFDGIGGVVDGLEQEAQGNGGRVTLAGGTSVVDANGHSVITANVSGGGTRTFIAYLLSPNRFFLLEDFTSPALAGTGAADTQPGGITDATLTGNYGFSGATVADPTGMVMWVNADGNGGMTGIADEVVSTSVGHTLTSVVVSNDYVTTANGVTAVTLNNPLVVKGFVFYVTSGTQSLVLGQQPDLDGFFVRQ